MREHKSFPFQLKEMDEESGRFTGYAAVFGNRDSYGDVIERGAFAKTINDKGGTFPVLWQHDPDEPIGVSTAMREDEKGLYVEAEVSKVARRGMEAMDLLRMKAINGLSIGFQVVQKAMEVGERRLTEIKLWEFSVVTFPANELALVTGIKSERILADALAKWAELDPAGFRATTLALLDQTEPAPVTPSDERAAATHDEPTDVTRVLSLLKQSYGGS